MTIVSVFRGVVQQDSHPVAQLQAMSQFSKQELMPECCYCKRNCLVSKVHTRTHFHHHATTACISILTAEYIQEHFTLQLLVSILTNQESREAIQCLLVALKTCHFSLVGAIEAITVNYIICNT